MSCYDTLAMYEIISLWTLGMISITYPLPKQCQFILYGVIAHILLVGQLFDLHPRRLNILFEGGNIVLTQCRLVDNFLQIFQNRAARLVTRLGWFTPVAMLLHQCGWLSVKQMVFYQRVVAVHKIVKTKSPLYLHQKMSTTHPYSTRQATGGAVRFGEQFGRKSLLDIIGQNFAG